MRVLALSFCLATLLLSGCGSATSPVSSTPVSPSPTPVTSSACVPFTGSSVRHGTTCVAGAHVYLFAASTASYGQPSVSLLNGSLTGASDSLGAYVTSGSDGSFSIAGKYTCSPNAQVYLYSLGGNAGSGANSAAGLLAVLGRCPAAGNFDSAIPVVYLNEVSTIAAAYAMAGFATDATHVASSGTALAQVGIANAFANTANLAGLATGVALATTPSGNGTAPQSTVHTLANILAACVGSTGASSSACSTLFANAPAGTTPPTDTATAAINMAHSPAANVTALYALASASPFTPALTSQPNAFTLGITFGGGGLSQTQRLAVDATGSVWILNDLAPSITKLSSLGTVLFGANGFTGGGLKTAFGIDFDSSGNAWIANTYNDSILELSSTGALLNGPAGYIGGPVADPSGLAIDASGNIWFSNYYSSVGAITPAGAPLAPNGGLTGGGLNYPYSMAISGAGTLWFADQASNSLTALSPSGAFLTGANGVTGGGLNSPQSIAIDHSGNVWVVNSKGNSVSEFSSTGTPISAATGFTGGGLYNPTSVAMDGAGNVWVGNFFGQTFVELSPAGAILSGTHGYSSGPFGPDCVAIDGSGDVWGGNPNTNGTVTELIGAATPVVTPLSAGVRNNTLGTRP